MCVLQLFIAELYGECKEGNGCRSTRNLKIVKWPVKSTPSFAMLVSPGYGVLKEAVWLRKNNTHGFDSSGGLQPVK